jgi:hypothetical protein
MQRFWDRDRQTGLGSMDMLDKGLALASTLFL